MQEILARLHIDQGFTFTEKQRRFIKPSNFVHGVAMHCISSSLAVRHRTIGRVCSTSSHHVLKSQPQRLLIDVLDGNADVTYSFIGAVAAYTAWAGVMYSSTGAGDAKVTAGRLLPKLLPQRATHAEELLVGVPPSALWLA